MTSETLKISPSQISLARQCLRRWHIAYVHGEREPQTAQQAYGVRVHKHLEDYLRDGKPIDPNTPEGKIALSGLKYLPEPGTGTPEQNFTIAGPGFVYSGIIDWSSNSVPHIVDHKTTSNLKYQKKEQELLADPQGILYPYTAYINYEYDVLCQWIYYRRTPDRPKAEETRFVYPANRLLEAKLALDEEVQSLISLRSSKTLDLPGNPKACFSYGKLCPHSDKCHDITPSTTVRLRKKSGESLMALPSTDDLLAQLMDLSTSASSSEKAPPEPSEDPLAKLEREIGPAKPTQEELDEKARKQRLKEFEEKTAKENEEARAKISSSETPTPPAEEEKKKDGRGRKPGQKTVGLKVYSDKPIGVLLIDCMPVGVDGVDRPEDLFDLCRKGIRESCKHENGNPVEHYKLIDYGKGVGLWAQAVRAGLSKMKYDYLYVSTDSGEVRDALDVLTSSAEVVIRGMR